MHDSRTALIEAKFKRALDDILARVFVLPSEKIVIAVAYSGGLDSSVLLRLTKAYADACGMTLHAFHVHHGLSPHADAWLAHCQSVCERRAVAFAARQVQVPKESGSGLEAAARTARYAALGEMCRAHHVNVLLTAHHQDDQAETVLLQMLRGAGLAGMSGMEVLSHAPELLGDEDTAIARPLLSLSRADLQHFAEDRIISHIEDESNINVHHPRNALRNEVLPLLKKHFPAYRECIARGALHAQTAQKLLEEMAAADLMACQDGARLNALALARLSADRAANVLRYWIVSQGLRPPSTAWLREAMRQLLEMRDDAQVCVQLAGKQLRRYRDHIVMVAASELLETPPLRFVWRQEASILFPGFGGILHFEEAEHGVAGDFLQAQALHIQYRSGGASLKLAANRPEKGLKDWYQERAIPAWERLRLPLIYADKSLLFAAGLGQDCRLPQSSPGIVLRWETC